MTSSPVNAAYHFLRGSASSGEIIELHERHEIVYTIDDYYDGPRSGVADFNGQPHLYQSLLGYSEEGVPEEYELTPLDEGTFRLHLQIWALWRKWADLFYGQGIRPPTHPYLPEDEGEYKRLLAQLDERRIVLPEPTIITEGKFERPPPHRPGSPFEGWVVRWFGTRLR